MPKPFFFSPDVPMETESKQQSGEQQDPTDAKSKPSKIKVQLLGLPEDAVYPMRNIPHGLCVIINNTDFGEARAKVNKTFSDRPGSEVDTGMCGSQF